MANEEFVRPEAIILDEDALVPDRNLISPAPNQFSHEVLSDQPFSFAEGGAPAGRLAAGAAVLLVHRQAEACWVIDARGLFVKTACAGLRPKTHVS